MYRFWWAVCRIIPYGVLCGGTLTGKHNKVLEEQGSRHVLYPGKISWKGAVVCVVEDTAVPFVLDLVAELSVELGVEW